MKGKTMVIGIVLFVVIVVAAVYFAMMSTINKIDKENKEASHEVMTYIVLETDGFTL